MQRGGWRGMRLLAGLAAAGLAGVGASSCGGEAATAAGPAVRDSAGIRIVENAAPAWSEGRGWSVDREPVLAVGVLEGDPARQLSGVVDPGLMSDGTLVLGDGGTQEVRAFAPDGSLRWRVGGRGEGPGEFMTISRLGVLPGDSVLVWDIQTRRTTILAPDGSLARSHQGETPEGATMASPVGWLDGGRILASGGVSFTAGEGTVDRVVRPPVAYYLVDPGGAVLDSLFSMPFRELHLRQDEGMMSVRSPPFGLQTFVQASGSRIVAASSERVELAFRSPEGDLVQLVRLDHTPPVPDAGDRATWEDHLLAEAAAEEDPAELRRQAAETEFPERFPALGALFVQPDGHVWARRWSPPWAQDDPGTWWVFDPAGVYLGRVETPAGLEVERVLDDVLVGVRRDALDVERVQVHPLRR